MSEQRPSDSPPPQSASPEPDPQAASDRVAQNRARLLEALRRPFSRGQLVVAVLLGLLGFAAVVQVRANDADDNFTGARQSDLIALINTLSQASDRARAEIVELRRTRDSLLDDSEATRTALSVARQRADTLGLLAGTLPAIGPGIRIVVDANPGDVGTDQILNGLQELRDSGAEAIELNDSVRVVASTSIQDSVDGGLLVDGVELRPPFAIDAIGAPATLAAALTFPGGFNAEIEQVGARVDVEESQRIEIASVREVRDARYADPVPQG